MSRRRHRFVNLDTGGDPVDTAFKTAHRVEEKEQYGTHYRKRFGTATLVPPDAESDLKGVPARHPLKLAAKALGSDLKAAGSHLKGLAVQNKRGVAAAGLVMGAVLGA